MAKKRNDLYIKRSVVDGRVNLARKKDVSPQTQPRNSENKTPPRREIITFLFAYLLIPVTLAHQYSPLAIELLTISLEQVSNEMSFMNLFKILNDCSTIWAALYCSPCEYFHFARFMFCHQSLHKPIVIIQIKPDIQYILTFCIRAEYHTFGIRTQVCDAGNTSC